MPKGYVISRVDVKDSEAYARYVAAATKAIASHFRGCSPARLELGRVEGSPWSAILLCGRFIAQEVR